MARKRRKSKAQTSGKFSKRVVAAVLVAVAAFTVTMIIVFIRTGQTPDTLIISFFTFAGGEAGVLGLIRYGDSKYPAKDESAAAGASDDTGSGVG